MNNRTNEPIWHSSVWITRVAIILGVVVISVGLEKPQFFQINIYACLAIVCVLFSIAGLIVAFWGVSRRSRRWRDSRFWLSVVFNVIIASAVSFLYMRGLSQPPYEHHDRGLTEGPELH